MPNLKNMLARSWAYLVNLTVTQEQINQFADATIDHQWIHVDEERAKREGAWDYHCSWLPDFSQLPYMWDQIIQVENI